MQLVERKRFPGEVLFLVLFLQMLGSYFSSTSRALLANGLVIIFTLTGAFNWSSKSTLKQGRKPSKITKQPSPPASKVTASKKVKEEPTGVVEGTASRVEAAPKKAESPREEVKAFDKDAKERAQKKKQRSRNAQQPLESNLVPEAAACPAPAKPEQISAPTSKPAKVASVHASTAAPAALKLVSSESEAPIDWVEYWNEGRIAVASSSAKPTKSKCEIAIQTVTEVEVQTEQPKKERTQVEKESFGPKPKSVPLMPPPVHVPQMPQKRLPKAEAEKTEDAWEMDLAAKFEEEARKLEEEARFLEEEAKRYLQEANQAQQEMVAAISEGSDTEAAQKISGTSSTRWADIEDQDDEWDDEAAFAIMGDMATTKVDDAPMVCADFLKFRSCPRGASCPWQHVNINEEVEVEDLKGVGKKTEEVLYKRGMLW